MTTDWVWIAIVIVLVCALVYSWARGAPAAAPAAKAEPKKEPPPSSAKTAPDRKSSPAAPPAAARASAPPAPARTSAPAPAPAPSPAAAAASGDLPKLAYEEESDEVDPTKVGLLSSKRSATQVPTKRIVYDEDAAHDEPTHSGALILVTATAQTDKGLKRKRNEDALLAAPEHDLYVVADGMGGYNGGEIASALAVQTMRYAFEAKTFEGPPHESIPARASELARAVQMANEAILTRAQSDKRLEGMGTTICAARFSPNKQRLCIAHVGDSRMYRLRAGTFKQMTSDHTMKDFGVSGAAAAHLSRAVGVWPQVPVDVILGKPRPGDLYLLCSDGLTKMVKDDEIERIVSTTTAPSSMVDALVTRANENGGKDNITVIVIRVDDAATRRPKNAASAPS